MSSIIRTAVLVLMEVIFLDIAANTFFGQKDRIRPAVRILGIILLALIISVNAILFQNFLPVRLLFNLLPAFLYIAIFYKAAVFEIFGVLIFYCSIVVSMDFIGIFIFRLTGFENTVIF